MPGIITAIYRRSAEVVHRRIADETLLVPVRGNLATLHQIFALNAVSDFVWNELSAPQSLASIRDKIASTFDVEVSRAEADLLELMSELERVSLVTEVTK